MAFVYTAAGEAAARISAYDNKNHRWQTESKQYDLQHGRRKVSGVTCSTDERKAAVAWTKSGRYDPQHGGRKVSGVTCSTDERKAAVA